jgi:radical SAM protein with 4Fe4S-binding SPASM domain
MKSWIAQGIALGIKAVTINGTFEPTMSPDYGEIIHYCRGEGLQVTLATNGSLLTRSSMRLLLDWDVAVLTKMNTPLVDEIDPRYEDLCRIQKGLFGAKGAARRVYEDQKRLIGALIDFGFNSHPQAGYSRLGVESVITTLNLPYLPELVAWLRVRNIYAHIEVAKMQGMGKRNGHIYPARQEVRKLFETIRQQDVSMGFPDWHPKPPCVATTCYENLYRVDIHADGKVRPCPSIEIDLGDLNRQSLAEVIRNEKLQVIRNLEKHIQGDCKNCELFRSRQCYGGCRGMVYQWAKSMGLTEYEALSASDPSCWRVEKALDNGLRAEACREAI